MPDISKRPEFTPDGLPFPYSLYGDTAIRTELIRRIGSVFLPDPRLVINMGSGYDITPSDAFPDARVIHVDLHTPEYVDEKYDIVNFLNNVGYEAYSLDELPRDLEFDVGISILAPAISPEKIAVGGILITTQTEFEPEAMYVEGVVTYMEEEEFIHNVISDTREVARIWDQEEEIHLAIYRKQA